jgi:hypothetical protein
MLDTVISALIAIYWFDVPFRGSWVTLMGRRPCSWW